MEVEMHADLEQSKARGVGRGLPPACLAGQLSCALQNDSKCTLRQLLPSHPYFKSSSL